MDLYVANCTQQNNTFMYKLPEVAQVRQQSIVIGGQIKIGNLNQDQLDAVIEQHGKYGMRRVSELDRVKNTFVPLICSDKPIPAQTIQRMVLHNSGVISFNGAETRKKLALGVDSLFKQRELEENIPSIDKLHLHVEEEDRKGVDSQVNEIITVDRENAPPAPARKRKVGF